MHSVPTEGDEFAKLTYHLRMAQEAAAMIAHLNKANDDHARSRTWLNVSSLMQKLIHQVTQIAMRRAN